MSKHFMEPLPSVLLTGGILCPLKFLFFRILDTVIQTFLLHLFHHCKNKLLESKGSTISSAN